MAKGKRIVGRVKNDGTITLTDKVLNSDGWQNIVTGLGIESRDKRMANTFSGSSRITQSFTQLEEMYDGDDVVGTFVDLFAEEMTRQWIRFYVGGGQDNTREIERGTMQQLEVLGAQDHLTSALIWSRLFGGGIVVMGVEDGKATVRPVDQARIQKISWLSSLDRWDVKVETKYEDEKDPRYGQPEVYRIQSSEGKDALIHESRTLRFDGVRVSRRRRQQNDGWGNSVLERTVDVIRDFQAASDGIAHLLQDFSQAVFKIKGLAKALAADKDELVKTRLRLLDIGRSLVRAVPLDAEAEEFDRKGAVVSGMAELFDRYMMRVSAATRMPVTLLFGRSPAGLNATGESDVRLFYDRVRAQQEIVLRPRLEYLIKLILLSKEGPAGGLEPETWGFKFNPLYQPTEYEIAQTRNLVANTDALMVDRKVLQSDEVRQSRYGKDGYSMETTLDRNVKVVSEEPEENAEPEMEEEESSSEDQNEEVPASSTDREPA